MTTATPHHRITMGCIALGAIASASLAQTLLVSDFSADRVERFHPSTGAFQSTVIDASDGVLRPHGILDRGTDILIAAFDSNAVFRLDKADGSIAPFITPASGLANPVYILEMPTQDLVVSSQGTDEVLRFDAAGAPLGALVTAGLGGLDGPSGMAISDGVLYVAGRHSANVLAYDASTGAFLTTVADASDGLGFGTTFGVQVAPNGDLYVASNGAVHRINLDTSTVIAAIACAFPIGIEIEPGTGDVLVATDANIRRIDADTNATSPPVLTGGSLTSLNFFHTAPPGPCPGDVTGDGHTNIADFNVLAGAFGATVTPGTNGDLTGDGVVNIADFNILAGDFECPG